LVPNARLQRGEALTVQATEDGLIAIRDLTRKIHEEQVGADQAVEIV
jgi:hypothetical protein